MNREDHHGKMKTRVLPLRFALASAVMLVACVGIVLLVRALPGGIYPAFFVMAGGVLFTLILASIFEWLVHRYLYHRKQPGAFAQIYRIHHQGHHIKIFPTQHYTAHSKVRRHPFSEPDISTHYPGVWRNVSSEAAQFAFYMVIGLALILTPAWLLTQSQLFLASIAVTLIIICDLFVSVHDAIHHPGQFRFLEAQPWYPFIERHHYIHHVDMEANVNFLLPLADWCYGTLRTTITSAEIAKHGTLEQAKGSPDGCLEPKASLSR